MNAKLFDDKGKPLCPCCGSSRLYGTREIKEGFEIGDLDLEDDAAQPYVSTDTWQIVVKEEVRAYCHDCKASFDFSDYFIEL